MVGRVSNEKVPANTASWLPAERARLEVGPAPYTPPRADEIVVRNRAVAVNPVDWIIQTAGKFTFSWIAYPFVLGADLAGDVVEVGSAVTRFRPGDRVLAHAVGTDPKRNSAAEGAFQAYTVVLERMTSPIPDDLTYERAAVLPLGLSTAACGLFQKDHLALDLPSARPSRAGQTVLVWGGSTSVGSNAIQLAAAAGYEVVTTCSPRNFAYVEKLGAARAFDYNDPSVVRRVIEALRGTTIAGALAIGAGSPEACVDVVRASRGKKFVSMATFPITFASIPDGPESTVPRFAMIRRFLSSSIALWLRSRTGGVRTKFIFGSTLAHNDVGKAIYADFLPAALADGRYVAAPAPQVAGTGFASIQTGLDLQKKGVSAAKVVIGLP